MNCYCDGDSLDHVAEFPGAVEQHCRDYLEAAKGFDHAVTSATDQSTNPREAFVYENLSDATPESFVFGSPGCPKDPTCQLRSLRYGKKVTAPPLLSLVCVQCLCSALIKPEYICYSVICVAATS